jgi:hypothetical protein
MPGLGDLLGNMFRPQQVQQPGQAFADPMANMGPMDRLGYMKQNNPEALMGLAAGLMNGNMGAGFAAAGDAMGRHREQYQEQQKSERKENLTKRWLMANRGLSDEESTMAMSNPAILGSYLKGGDDNEYQQRAAAAQQHGLTGEDAQSFILTGQLPSGRFGSAEVGLQTIPVRDKDGNIAFVQPSKSGTAVQTQFPEGYTPLSPYDRAFETSSGQTAGKGIGEAQATYQSMISKMPGLEYTVKRLDDLAERATYTLAGQGLDAGIRQLGMEPREAAVARADYISTVDNQILPLLRDTFGAQFTQKEGETLRATLGNPDVSPKEKQAILKSFIEQKRRDIEALARQTGQTAPAQGGGSVTGTGVQWSIEP